MSKVQDQILAQEETLSAQKEKRLNQFTRVKAAAQGVSLVVGGVIGAMALNPVALVTMVTKAYNLHETLKDSKNRNFADSRIVSRQRVDDVLSVLGPDVRPFEDTISKHFKDSELNHIVKKLDANELTVSDI